MDDHLKEALDIVKAQASVRIMSEDEIISMVRRLSSDIKNVAEGEGCVEELASSDVQSDPRKSIKEKSITCMECGKTFKILTRKHLASHNLDAAEYREKWGLKKDTPLVCKGLQRERRKKMKDMKLWEKRRKVEEWNEFGGEGEESFLKNGDTRTGFLPSPLYRIFEPPIFLIAGLRKRKRRLLSGRLFWDNSYSLFEAA